MNPLIRTWNAVWRPTPGSLRLLALLGVIGNVVIVVSGGAVRVTKSGLGCPDWPRCTGDSLVPTHNPEHHVLNMSIEFGNRLITFVVLGIGVLVFVAALRLRPRRRDLVRWALAQPMSVVAQAVIGGIVVLTELHPAAVSLHFLVSPALLVFCVALWVRAGEGDAPPRRLAGPRTRALAAALLVSCAAVLVAGTVVTGTGPHAGDAEARRYGFDITDVARIHGELAWATIALTAAVIIALYRSGAAAGRDLGPARRRAFELAGIILAQGAVGYVQYALGVPEWLVLLHMLGAVLMWIAAFRLFFALRDRGPVPAEEAPPVTCRAEAPQPV
ncbi:cytochrome c oxidase assembly protein subunit 15 [Actinomadura madurae]|uniref:Cytochrome c oxidase assembly protein subunit 15 n=1 Tax=Actinomadura madurae TaxID=1993 RepID=A0A1I5UQC7_9ACTN|nr:cytochrome c oxidase assembly protein subunit 15 [Actinomadura madurae]SPT56631.1 Cytochrome oxidase assembly protein [Actinomadura madurae]